MERREKAETAFLNGYNCAQSIAMAFSDLVNVPKEELCRLCSPLGGGLGRMREVCGAVNASVVILGLIAGYDTPETGSKKAELYALVQSFARAFEGRNDSIVCRELLKLPEKHSAAEPTPRTGSFYQDRPCKRLIGDAAELLEITLRDNGFLA